MAAWPGGELEVDDLCAYVYCDKLYAVSSVIVHASVTLIVHIRVLEPVADNVNAHDDVSAPNSITSCHGQSW